MKSARGFTLLEIIVVIAIFGVMAVMAYGGLASVLHSRQRVAAALDRTAELQRAYMRLREDFQQVSNRPVRDNYGDAKPAFYGNRDNQLLFTHGGWRNPLLLPRASLERVIYRLDEKTGTLIRGSYRVLDLAQDSKPVEVPLLSEVDDLHWRYLDPATQEWRTTWPPDTLSDDPATLAAIAPPLAVELTLETKDLGELKFLFKLGLDPLPNGFVRGEIPSGGSAATTGATP
jgi:general secretion pathway protein J